MRTVHWWLQSEYFHQWQCWVEGTWFWSKVWVTCSLWTELHNLSRGSVTFQYFSWSSMNIPVSLEEGTWAACLRTDTQSCLGTWLLIMSRGMNGTSLPGLGGPKTWRWALILWVWRWQGRASYTVLKLHLQERPVWPPGSPHLLSLHCGDMGIQKPKKWNPETNTTRYHDRNI